MHIIAWIALGLVAGILAKFIMPGKDRGGLIMTMVLGVVGAVVGGFIAMQLGFGNVDGFDLRSLLIAVGGSLLVLFIYRLLKQRGAL